MKRTALTRRAWTPGRSARQLARTRTWSVVTRARAESVNFYCEGQIWPGCTLNGVHGHHVVRDRSLNTFENCRWLCNSCHRWVHDHPAEARERGLLASKFCPQGPSAEGVSPPPASAPQSSATPSDDPLGAGSYTVVCDFCEWWGYVTIHHGGFICGDCHRFNEVEDQ